MPIVTIAMQVVAGVGMDGGTAVVEHLDLRQEETSHWQQGVCPGQLPRMFYIYIAFGLDIWQKNILKTFWVHTFENVQSAI